VSRSSSRGSSCGSSSTTSPTPCIRVPRHVARLVTRLVVDYFAYAACPGASAYRAAHRVARRVARRAARRRLLHQHRASGCLGTSHDSLSTSSPTPRVRVPRHVARLVFEYFASCMLVLDYFAYAARPGEARHGARRRLLRLHHASQGLDTSRGSSSTTSPTPRVRVPQHVAWLVTRLVVDYFAYTARLGVSARRTTRCRLLRLHRASGSLGTSRGSSSTTSPRACSSSTTSPTPRVRVRLVTGLVVDYFAYTTRLGASTRRAARRRLLHQHRASGCLSTSRGSSRGSSSTTSPTPRVRVPRHVARLVVDFFAYTARPGPSACHVARLRLLRLAHAHPRLLRLRRASGCLGTSRGSSSTTSPMPCIRVPRHVARLAVDYFAYTARLGASARRAARRRLLQLRGASGCLGTSRGSSRGLSRRSSSTTSCTLRVRVPWHVARLVTRLVVDYFDYTARPSASSRHAAHRAARHRLLRLRRGAGCLGTLRGSSRGSSRHSSSTTSPMPRVRVPWRVAQLVARLVVWLVVDYFANGVHPGASTRCKARHTGRRQLLCLLCAS
jgi:hypothetical protein